MRIRVTKDDLGPLLIAVLLIAVLSLGGCVSYSHSEVQLSDAVSVLSVGDDVRIKRQDGTTACIRIKKIDDADIAGSSRTHIFGQDVSIPFSDVASITLHTRNSLASEAPTIFAGIFLGLLATAAIF